MHTQQPEQGISFCNDLQFICHSPCKSFGFCVTFYCWVDVEKDKITHCLLYCLLTNTGPDTMGHKQSSSCGWFQRNSDSLQAGSETAGHYRSTFHTHLMSFTSIKLFHSTRNEAHRDWGTCCKLQPVEYSLTYTPVISLQSLHSFSFIYF